MLRTAWQLDAKVRVVTSTTPKLPNVSLPAIGQARRLILSGLAALAIRELWLDDRSYMALAISLEVPALTADWDLRKVKVTGLKLEQMR